jgi:hypothetical protein
VNSRLSKQEGKTRAGIPCTLPVSSKARIASLASTGNDEAITTETLRLLDRVLDCGEVHITLVTRLLHMFEELKKGKGMVSTSIDGATELRVEVLMLVADVLS